MKNIFFIGISIYIDSNIVVSFDVHDEIFNYDKNGRIIKKIKI